MPHFKKLKRFLFNFFRVKSSSLDILVAGAESAVQAVVHADIAYIERSKQDYPFAVDRIFYMFCRVKDLFYLVFFFCGKEGGRFFKREPF